MTESMTASPTPARAASRRRVSARCTAITRRSKAIAWSSSLISAVESTMARRIAVVRVFVSLACSSAPVNDRCSFADFLLILSRRGARGWRQRDAGSADTVIVCASPSAMSLPSASARQRRAIRAGRNEAALPGAAAKPATAASTRPATAARQRRRRAAQIPREPVDAAGAGHGQPAHDFSRRLADREKRLRRRFIGLGGELRL